MIGPLIGKIWESRSSWAGKALGSLFVFVAGWYGLIIGLLVGHLTDELLKQFRSDRAIASYFENPSPGDFIEVQKGSAAFCALAVALVSASGEKGRRQKKLFSSGEEFGLVEYVGKIAAKAFGPGSEATYEAYARIAASRLGRMNIDLLSESLAARRAASSDAALMAQLLGSCVEGERKEAGRLMERIRGVLDPEHTGPAVQKGRLESWRLLGLEGHESLEEVKVCFRHLAVQFHPDAHSGLDQARSQAASEAFLRIEAAYRDILQQKGS